MPPIKKHKRFPRKQKKIAIATNGKNAYSQKDWQELRDVLSSIDIEIDFEAKSITVQTGKA